MEKIFVIRAYARPCGTMLSLNVNGETGKSYFVALNGRNKQEETINLSQVANSGTLKEFSSKSGFNVQQGYVVLTVALSKVTKDFINACWEELKQLKPKLCIK